MRIAVDFRVLSTEAANRGMGRYTQQQLREVLKLDHDNDYLVLTYPYLKSDLIYPEILAANNVQIKKLAFSEIDNNALILPLEKVFSYSAKFQDFLFKEKVDLFHATTPFLDPIICDFDVCRLTSTLYDLIPYVFPRQYLATPPDMEERYSTALHFLRGSQRLISISKSAVKDVYTYLGYDKNNVDVAYPTVDPWFQVLPEEVVRNTLTNLSRRFKIPSQFILSITGIHYSKNATTLFEAYQMLPFSLQEQLPLVVNLPAEWVYNAFKETYGSLSNLILTHSLTDNELAALYNAAMMVVHPSRYEGFGYPVAEAMKCGTPVITTTSSSLPEVGGDAAILLDPEDVEGFRAAIQMLFDDPKQRARMSKCGLAEVEKFSLDQLGMNTLENYRKSLAPPDAPVIGKHVAMWSSFPPLKCGVADYTAELADRLSQSCDLEIFIDSDYLPSIHLSTNYRIHHHSAFERRNNQRSFDVIIYQMGSTTYQDFMYDQLEQYPGVVVFHDLLMGYGYYLIYGYRKQQKKFRKKILEVENKEVVAAFDRITRYEGDNANSQLDELFRKHYLLRWIINNSLIQIVHMQDAKQELEDRYSNANVKVVDMGVADPWDKYYGQDTNRFRIRYGILPSTFVIGIFGSVVPVKRIGAAFEALKNIVIEHPDVLLLIIGDQIFGEYMAGLSAMVIQLGLQTYVRFTGRTSRDDFDRLFLACDAVINLRYPTYKGMSAILVRSLAAAKPIIITDVPEWADFPEDFCWRVKPDEKEVENLTICMKRLVEDRAYVQQASKKARLYFEKRGTLDHMASQYSEIILQVVSNKE